MSKPSLTLGSKLCSEAKIAEPSHHPEIVSTESNCRSRGLRARDTLGRQVGMGVWKPPGSQETGLSLFSLGPKSMACFLIAGSLGTDSQSHILLLAAFVSHRCATEWWCQLAILLGADILTSPSEDQARLPSSIPCPLERWEGKHRT